MTSAAYSCVKTRFCSCSLSIPYRSGLVPTTELSNYHLKYHLKWYLCSENTISAFCDAPVELFRVRIKYEMRISLHFTACLADIGCQCTSASQTRRYWTHTHLLSLPQTRLHLSEQSHPRPLPVLPQKHQGMHRAQHQPDSPTPVNVKY